MSSIQSPIDLPAEEAKRHYEEYRALGARATVEDVAIQAVYREIARGHTVIDVKAAIVAGGHDEAGRPRLAFARADEPEIACWREGRYLRGEWEKTGDLRFWPSMVREWQVASRSRRLEIIPAALEGWPPLAITWYAMTPIIPAALRPRGDLSRYHLLWEAEWSEKSSLPVPPRDPALLRHITGTLYSVLAVWDLTEVERAVLGMRSQEQPA